MRSLRSSFLCALLVAGVFGAATPARAQNQGFQLNRYEPTAAGEWSFAVDHPWYSATRFLAAGVTLNYGHDPLILRETQVSDGSFTTRSLIGHQLIGHLDLAGSLVNRVLLSFSLPITLLERGDDTTAARFGVRPVSSGAVGDPRFGAMFRVFGEPYKSAFSLSLGAYVWVPINTGTFPEQTGESGFRFLPKVVLGGLSHNVMWSFLGGFYVRPEGALGNLPATPGNSLGPELQLGAAIAYANLERRFSIGPEAILHTEVLNGNAFSAPSTNLELLLGLNYNIARVLQLGVAGGAGILRGAGTPDARVLLRLSYAPMGEDKPKDEDNDGIADRDDACPEIAGIRTGVAATNGCPPPAADGDHDGFVDTQDVCPSEPVGDHPDLEKPGCPLRDSDGDGLLDNQDQCPSEPAGQRPDAQKPGCPLRDSDGDGVYDNEDRCVTVAAGAHPSLTSVGCPDKDGDGDGVYDSRDQCPTVNSGYNPDAAKPGCPLPDRDRDQVPDAVDACPDQAGAPSPEAKKNGCPGLVEVKAGQIVIKQQVFFATGKDVVLKKSFGLLDVIAHTLQTLPQIRRVMVEGHTDNKGKPELNTELSDRRAKSVRQYLLGKGVAATRLEAKGFGPSQPIADNKSNKGRALNRRVDFRIVDPPQAGAAGAAKAPTATPAPAPTPAPTPTPAPASKVTPAAAPPAAAPAATKPSRHHRRGKGAEPSAATEAAPGDAGAAPASDKEGKSKRKHHSKAKK